MKYYRPVAKEFNYKDVIVLYFENPEDLVICIHNRFGFRWFRTADKSELILKIKKAYDLTIRIENKELDGFNYNLKTRI